MLRKEKSSRPAPPAAELKPHLPRKPRSPLRRLAAFSMESRFLRTYPNQVGSNPLRACRARAPHERKTAHPAKGALFELKRDCRDG